jgi:phenylpyruvate tautomerase PptA (4-oxalocrotonate tautomerase family)
MPLVRISVYDKTPAEKRRIIADSVYDAMRATLGIPENDRFIVITGHSGENISIDPGFMGMHRTENFVLINVTLRAGRSVEVKQSFYRELARLLEERAAISPDNVMIVLSPNSLEDWSFGRGEAQYVVNAPAPSEVSR